MSKLWSEQPRKALRASQVGPIADFDSSLTPGLSIDREAGEVALTEMGGQLAELQERLFADGRTGGHRSVLLVLQGMDTAGKGGVVRSVGGMLDPQGLSVTGFGRPTEEERAEHFLGRIRRALPPAGRVGIFDRSHYEDVLPVRVLNLAPESVWRPRFAEINEFEAELADSGVTIVKCLLTVSKDEQKDRLTKRLERSDKHWKFDPSDIDSRALWDDYLVAYQDILDQTDTDVAPWHLIPSDRKWYSRLAVAQLLYDALAAFDLDWPTASFDVEAEKKRLAASD